MDSDDDSDGGTAAREEDPDGYEWTVERLQKLRQEQEHVIKHLENRMQNNEPEEPEVHRLSEMPV